MKSEFIELINHKFVVKYNKPETHVHSNFTSKIS